MLTTSNSPSPSSSGSPTVPETMQAAVARSYGGPEVITVEDLRVQPPGKGQIQVKVIASSLNALDWHFITGTPYLVRLVNGFRRPKRIVPGADVAGIVTAIGEEVSRFAVGDRIFGECSGGGCAPYLVMKESSAVHLPDNVSFEAAGATPVAGLTAVQGLRTKAHLQPGEHVLINGAAGGVGTFAVQIAKAMGATVTGVCSTRNVDMVRRLGADHVIDYTTDDFTQTDTRYDVMLDNVGNRKAAEFMPILNDTARYVAVSGPKEGLWLGPVIHVVKTAMSLRRSPVSFHQFTAAPNQEDNTYLGELLANGSLVPEIQRTIDIHGVQEAVAEIGTGHTRAKIVVTHSHDS